MNYPVWEVAFGSGLVMAVVSVVHVFVSHFAVGGGLFLVLTEHKAYRENDTGLLEWLKKHTRFFVLVTVVFGAVTGVGIWFTIGLIQPTATSNLIHIFVWGWAIEWVFFFLEITAALLYLYGWQKVERKLHLIYGWIYFITAFMSMVVINGMVSFMLTPGDWLQTHNFWDGFFNPTYWPSLFTRFLFSLALAGIYALFTATLQKDKALRAKIVKWSLGWVIPAFILVALSAWWYRGAIPEDVWLYARGVMPTATFYLKLMIIFAVLTFVLAALAYLKAARLPFAFAVVITLTAFVTMWSFEFVREAIRKPYVIYDYVYGNSLYVRPMPGDGGFNPENLQEKGMLQTAKWVQQREINEQNMEQVGKEIFRLQCMSCHTTEAYRGVKQYIETYQWDEAVIAEMLRGIELMREGVMPPFAGNDQERLALARYLANLAPQVKPLSLKDGEKLYASFCGVCHRSATDEPAVEFFKELEKEEAMEILDNLPDLMEQMPALELSPQQKQTLYEWLKNR
ncbi:cytochrome ubiquinol oxidase subunit I [Calditrichota bacterium GD2]